MDLNLKDKVAIVTGVCGVKGVAGVGAAITRVFAEQGINVVANYIVDGDDVKNYVDELNKKHGTKCMAVYGDISKPEDIDNIIEKAIQAYGKIDILVNNAAILPVTNIIDMPDEEWERVIKINLNGTFFFCKRFAKQLIKLNRPGRIVNITSKSGFFVTSPGRSHYATSKGGIITLTKALAREFTQYGIIVNAIAPGILRTPLNNELLEDKEIERNYVKRIPLGRLTDPEEIANIVSFLVSEKSESIVGTTIDATGGMLI
ncbi:MAG TPA: SDR family oxidoreductase [Clostridiales bacterium]|nr:SDR family oxidoreductase [Clostridiales bacterium]